MERQLVPLLLVLAVGCTPLGRDERLPEVNDRFETLDDAVRAALRGVRTTQDGSWLQLGDLGVRVDEGRLAMHDVAGRVGELELVRWGRGGRAAPVADVSVDGPLVRFDRGDLVEWYHHRDDGLEQGFTIHRAPDGAGELELVMGAEGFSGARFEAGTDAIVLSDGSGLPRLRVAGLFVEDARGLPLEAWLDADCDGLRCEVSIVIDDRGAAYPVYVDPLLSAVTADRTSVDATALLGASVDIDGDRAVVGAPGTPGLTDGIAVVLERNVGGSDTWGIEDTLVSGGLVGFGSSVAIDYPVVAVGAPGSDRVVVFQHEGSGANPWSTDPVTGTIVGNTEFGRSVDVVGSFVVVGNGGDAAAYSVSGVAIDPAFGNHESAIAVSWPLVALRGASTVEVYHMQESAQSVQSWTVGAGDSVAIHGERVAWGVPGEGDGQVVVQTLRRVDMTPAYDNVATQVVVPPVSFPESTRFGQAVALHADTLAVGDEDWVHLYEWDGAAWGHVDSLEAPTSSPSIALDDRAVLVGMPDMGTGSVRVWSRDADRWSPGLVTAPDESLGRAVALSGPRAAVGVPDVVTVFGGLVQGQVVVLDRVGSAWSVRDVVPGFDVASQTGTSVALDDGLLLVGDPGANQARLFVDQSGVMALQRTITSAETGFGTAVALDDGFVAIGAPQADAGKGLVHLELLELPSLATRSLGSYEGTNNGDRVGGSLDIDGSRLAFGASNASSGAGYAGVGTLGLSGGALVLEGVSVLEQSNQAGERCGTDVALEDDLVLVGCRAQGTKGPGRVQLFGAAGVGSWSWDRDLVSGEAVLDSFGAAVELSNDRAVVGAPDIDRVFVFERNEGGEDQWGPRDDLALVGAGGREYGLALAFEGRHLVVGEPDIGGVDGQAHFYALDGALPPVARPDTVLVDEDDVLSIDVTVNDFDGNGDPFDVLLASGPADGEAIVVGDRIEYTPDPDFSGVDSLTYFLRSPDGLESQEALVDIAVQPVNDAPTVPVLPSYTVLEDELTSIDASTGLLSYVEDIDSPVEDFVVDTPGVYVTDEGGTFDVQADGSFTYQPVLDFTGTDGVDVVITDGLLPTVPDPVHVTLEVVNVAEAPVIVGQVLSVTGAALKVPAPGLLAGGYAPQGPRVWTVQPRGAVGELLIDGSGALTYRRGAATLQTDTFDVSLSVNGLASEIVQVVVTAEPSYDLPVGVPDAYAVVLGEILDVEYGDPNAAVGVLRNDHGQPGAPVNQAVTSGPVPYGLELGANGGLRYVTQSVGTVTFEYVAQSTAGASAPTLVTIEVLPAPTGAPVAVDDDYDTDRELVVAVADGVLGNDAGVSALTAQLHAPPERGRVSLASDGSFVYVPPSGFVGTDQFTYRASDGSLQSDIATVTIEVSGAVDTSAPATADTGEPTAIECSLPLLPDRDGDGYGDDASEVVLGCEPGLGLVAEGGDCDDRDAEVHPGAAEVADDGTDQDCDGADVVLDASGSCATVAAGAPGWLLVLLLVVGVRRRDTLHAGGEA